MDFSNRDSQLTDSTLFVGILTRTKVQQLVEEGDVSPSQQRVFFNSVRAFYTKAMEYALQNLPLNDELLQNAAFTNVSTRLLSSFSQVEYFV